MNKPAKKSVLLLAAVLAALGLLAALVVPWFLDVKEHQWKLYDEWECSQGQAPYFVKEGGERCAKVGSRLPRGAHWDPLGNRPYSCNDRPGWRQILGTDRYGNYGAECYPADKPIPKGWSE